MLFDDPCSYSAAFCARQCGKGFTVARLMLDVALRKSGALVVYVAQTHAEARNIMWTEPWDGLPAIVAQHGIECSLNESRLELSFPNGSIIRLTGLDRAAWSKLRGQKLDLLILDEAQKAEDGGLERALLQVIPDCLAARRGIFRAIGTPDEFCIGILHDICTSGRPGWTVHHWTAEDLKDVTGVWAEQLRWKSEHGIADDDPVWLREKRGLWVRQDDRLMLPLNGNSLWDGKLPELIPSLGGPSVPRREPPAAYAGLDFGWTDAAALVVGSVSREEGVLRELHSDKRPGLNTQQLADWVRQVVREHGVRLVYCDSADAKTIEDLRTLHRLPVVAAEKHDKEPWIQEMRAHVLDGRLRIREGSPLHSEVRVLSPDPRALLRKKLSTRPGSDDHCWDAFRYVFRGVWSNHVRTPEPPMSVEERAMRDVQRHREEQLGPRPVRSRDDVRTLRLRSR